MPVRLSIDDFKSTVAVCELRFEEAYLLYDRTGKVGDSLRKDFNDFKVVDAAPHQSTFQSKEGSFVLELKACRFSTKRPGNKLDSFGRNCKLFFDCVTANLGIKVFTRVGLRVMFRKDFENVEDAKMALNALALTTLDPIERFGVAEPPSEVMLRWEDTQVGTMLRLKAETSKFDVVLPAEIEPETSEIHKSFHGLNLDVDYYTVAPVDVSQWDAASWITHSIRTVRRDTDRVFGN